MDNRGQAFSAFQLLISAVVAVAILAIIMSILNLIPRPSQDPSQAVSSVLQNVVNSPGTLQETTSVIFSTSASTVSAETLASGVGLSPDQICLDLGEYKDETNTKFKLLSAGASGQVIQWTGMTDKQARISVLCALDGESLADYVENKYFETLTEPDECDCYGEDTSGRCCLVQLRRA